jgi:hypothetical protein
MQKYCGICGESTIAVCPNCNTPIRGEYESEGFIFIGFHEPPAPRFCHECGHSYPWTLRKMDAAKELGDELDELSKDEKEKLKSSLDDLVTDNPRTELAATRFKKIMSKVGKDSYETMKTIAIEIMSEATRNAIFGN